MREILFKAKRLDNGEWVEGYYSFVEKMLCEENVHVIFPYNSGVYQWENGKSKPSQMAKELFFSFCKNKDINPDLYRKGGA